MGTPPTHRHLRRAARTIERVVGCEVHDGEWRLVLFLFANLFLLLTAYYILKVIREPLILAGGGAVRRSYARGIQAGLLAIGVPIYSAVANRIEPARLVKWIFASFAVTLTGFYVLGRAGLPVGFAFFVWLGIFSTVSITQFWSLANDVMTEAEGRRLFPLVAAAGTIGGISGAQIAARAISWLNPYQLMLVAAVVLSGCIVFTQGTQAASDHRRARAPADESKGTRDERGGFTLIVHDRYLLMIAISVFILNVINTTGDFILAEIVNARAHHLAAGARRQFIGAFYGNFQTYVSIATAAIQILAVGRVFKRLGVGSALLFLPLVAVTGYGASALLPILSLVTAVKVVENSTEYSLQNTIQQALFLPTSRDAKYKAKAAIDTVSVRAGDLASTGLVFVGVELGMKTMGFAAVNMAAALLWIAVAVAVRRRHHALAAAQIAETRWACEMPHRAALLMRVEPELVTSDEPN